MRKPIYYYGFLWFCIGCVFGFWFCVCSRGLGIRIAFPWTSPADRKLSHTDLWPGWKSEKQAKLKLTYSSCIIEDKRRTEEYWKTSWCKPPNFLNQFFLLLKCILQKSSLCNWRGPIIWWNVVWSVCVGTRHLHPSTVILVCGHHV